MLMCLPRWNEWKIVTSLGQNAHPSIVDFYSFVVSDSYALVTMYDIIPVSVTGSRLN